MEELEKLDSKEVLKAYTAILKAEEEALLAKLNKKEAEKKLKEEYALKKQFFKKDGKTLDLAKVKMNRMLSAMEINAGGPNKLEAEVALQEQYLIDLRKDSGIANSAKTLQNKMIAVKDSSGNAKDVAEELKTMFDSEVIDAIKYIVKEEISVKKAALEGTEEKNAKKGNKKTLEIAVLLKKKIGKK